MKKIINDKKIILWLVHIGMALLFLLVSEDLFHKCLLCVALLEIVMLIVILTITLKRPHNRLNEYVGVWMLIVPICASPIPWIFTFLDSTTTVMIACFSLGAILTALCYRTEFCQNLIEGILIFLIFTFGVMGMVYDVNLSFDTSEVMETQEILLSKYQNTNVKIPEISPELIFQIKSPTYGEIEVYVSETEFNKYNPGDELILSANEGALGLKYCYVEELGYSPFFRLAELNEE